LRSLSSPGSGRFRLLNPRGEIVVVLTWVTPLSGEPFGPGFLISGSSDVAGPFEPGSYWEITLTAPANENIVGTMTVPYLSNAFGVLSWWPGTIELMGAIHPFAPMVSGQSAQLEVSLVQPTFGVADSDTMPVVMDWVTGQTEVLKQFLRQMGAGAGQGLTEEEHDAVLATQSAVITTMGIPGDSPAFGLADFLAHPPLFIGGLSTPPYVLEGDGELPDLHTAGHARFGLYWLATTIPPGLSHVHGNTEEYTNRLVQFRTTHVVGGVELVTEVFDAHWHGGMWRWETALPTAIDYSVLPGVVVEVRYWQYPAV